MAIISSLIYIAFGIAFLTCTILHGQTWANWCWRWAIIGSLFDSLFAIRKIKTATQQPQLVLVFLFSIAFVETLLVIISPAIPTPVVARYITFGAIICHVLWTSLSALFLLPPALSRCKMVRLGASVGQGLGAIASIWTPLGFVVLFCSCSIIVYVGELHQSRQPLLPIASTNIHSTSKSRQKYKIVFFGQGVERTQSLQKALSWPRISRDAGGLIMYEHPTRNDTTLISVHPRIEAETDGWQYMRCLIRGATAVVLAFNLGNPESFKYIKALKGFPEEQPGLLVGYPNAQGESFVSEKDAQDLAREKGWGFTMSNDVIPAFEDLLGKMFAKPHPKGRPCLV
ncbi:hypothetical protein F5B22DRAFT_645443 [Xylaria bambusicola]|uniref:uncharacterized protein n=1 Tax=Xylaria bambusicola TaxID=326684 RepID=UPI0020078BDC|nr:uncharacterized protein F5B22DRAFT_645443 [Xylaria bambusicola]KAI0517737.1 hypothetical protein F5B22DRAFT_645443 [Xylaria bambusicola]